MQKAGLVELVNDDRAILLGAFLDIAQWLQEETPPTCLPDCADEDCALWMRIRIRGARR